MRWLWCIAVGASLIGSVVVMPVIAQDLTAEAVLEDIAQFREQFLDRDQAYAPAAREEAQRRLARLEQSADTLDGVRLGLGLAQIAALADNGHSASMPGPRIQRSNRLAIRFVPMEDGFVVLRARHAHTDLLGARLLAIDGQALARLREVAHTLSGGPPAWRDRSAPFLFESPQQLFALGLAKEPGEALYRLALADGRIVETRLLAESPSAERPTADTESLLLPEVMPAEMGWAGVLDTARAPWSLRDARELLRWRHDPALQALVLDMRAMADSRSLTLIDFFEQMRAAASQHQPEHLVLDLRQNGGGDLTRIRDFAESLPALVPGRLFVLTGPWTFSAAISTLGYLKQAAPARVTIVGEPVGDRLEFFAEGRFVWLKHSGEVLLPATERHDYVNACRSFTDCHGPVRRRPIAVRTLEPDIAAPWTLGAYSQGLDPALQAVAATLQRP